MNFVKNYFSTLAFLAIWYVFYRQNETFLNFSYGGTSLSFIDISVQYHNIFYAILIAYTILLIPFYIIYPHRSKARLAIRYIWEIIKWWENYWQKHKTALLAWIVKLFFAPLMIVWITQHVFNLWNSLYYSYQGISLFSTDFLLFFNSYFFTLAFTAILFFDVLLFTLWYLLESPAFKNTIKSVEPTILGWFVVLICYPPFNTHLTEMIWWYSTDFPQFINPYIHVSLNIVILILMGIYAWASIALGLKASNLTNRWIISRGPYKYVRHPAYICKNLAWFIGALPLLWVAITTDDLLLSSVLIGTLWWAFVYYMRSMTEEAHLSLDPEYVAYKKQVPYKFIPKVW